MTTLTETAYISRRIINWSILGLIGLVVLRILFSWTVNVLRQAFPAPPLRPNYAFSKLPRINFPQSASPSSELTFTLQTITGALPVASDAARVFFMPKGRSNFLSLTNAQEKVGRIGFTASPRQLTATAYRWIDTKSTLRSFEMDIVTNHFNLAYAYIHDLTLFSERQVPSSSQVTQEAQQFLQTLGITVPDINTAGKIIYLKLVGDKLESTTSQSQAEAVQVDFFRKDIDSMRVLTDNPGEGMITFIFSGSRRSDRHLLSVKYGYWPVDLRTAGIYKLKTSEQAWQELGEGKGYFVSLPKGETQIAVTNVYLAFYDSKEPQLFLQPVFVFEGDPKFVAYVPAVAPPWTE